MARPKSQRAHSQIIEAAVSLFAEGGIEATSMDAIARGSGVSKATIYRHWPDKDALILEVLVYLHGLDRELPVFDSGDFRGDLVAQLEYDPAADRRAMRERILPHLMAYASHNRVFGEAWRSRVISPARLALGKMIERGKERGILQRALDPEVGLAMLLGPLIYRKVFVLKQGGRAPKDFESIVADSFIAAFSAHREVQGRSSKEADPDI
ncbi:Transcriptional regulator, TetR family [Acidisarcina polymorpha]|uniref:Transcriptional regulator, TetR family n=1 Tax=Acidisarcina polymorpha TaxID=2211140 RepID=A0A2Z5FXW5_9BACT|nr:TetR/AcrR family transcriptional regulator [Acidisarcina polymorpha]AXC11733.1 Transcriptional regulator, TetR family [Acidisarcina polymorpha]